jgi:transposase
MKKFTSFCGIDVSKDTLDYCIYHANNDKAIYKQITNDAESIKKVFSSSKFDNILFILEATGNYSSKLIYGLKQLKRPCQVVNPLRSKAFMVAMGYNNKNDKQAAYCLSKMGQQSNHNNLYEMPSKEIEMRKQQLSVLQSLIKQRLMLENQIHAIKQLAIIDQTAIECLEKALEIIKEQIAIIEKKMYQPSKDKDFKAKKKLAQSVVGIGAKTAIALLIATNGLNNFDNANQLASFLGLTPYSHYSGSSVRKKGKITKHGSSQVRALLYMATTSAIRYNKTCKDLFERLRKKGKPYKVAIVAVMRKLAVQVFACVKKQTMFDRDYHIDKKQLS